MKHISASYFERLMIQAFMFSFFLLVASCSISAAPAVTKKDDHVEKELKSIEEKLRHLENVIGNCSGSDDVCSQLNHLNHEIEEIERTLGHCSDSNDLCAQLFHLRHEVEEIERRIGFCEDGSLCSFVDAIESGVEVIINQLADCPPATVCSFVDAISTTVNTVQSEVEVIVNQLADCPPATVCSFLDSISTQIGDCCTYTIRQSDFFEGGYVIGANAPGVYCLLEDVQGSILIGPGAYGVTLRCCDHTILGAGDADVITIAPGCYDIVIQDGFLTSIEDTTGNGIVVAPECGILKFVNMRTAYCRHGFYFDGTSGPAIESVEMYDCSARFSLASGFRFENVFGAIVEDCIAVENTNSGFDFVTGRGYMVLNCIANANGHDGFRIGSNASVSDQIRNSKFLGNKAVDNEEFGFDLNSVLEIASFTDCVGNFVASSFFMGNNCAIGNEAADYNPYGDQSLAFPCCLGRGPASVLDDGEFFANVRGGCPIGG